MSKMVDLNNKKVILDLGCGSNKHKYPNSVCIDWIKNDGVDLVHDLSKEIPYLDNSVDLIHASHCIEHLEFFPIMKEIHRVLKTGGMVIIKVPHCSNGIAYSDPTHKQIFGVFSFDQYNHYSDKKFKVVEKKLSFHYGTLKGIANYIFNKHQRIYEQYLCWIFPCYEIKVILKPIK